MCAGGTLRIPLCLVDQLGLPLRLPPGPLRDLLTAHTRVGLQRAGSAAEAQQAAERLAVGGGTARGGRARAPEREDLGQACEVVGWEWPEEEEQEQGGQLTRLPVCWMKVRGVPSSAMLPFLRCLTLLSWGTVVWQYFAHQESLHGYRRGSLFARQSCHVACCLVLHFERSSLPHLATQVQLVQSSSQQAQGQGHAALGVLFAPPRGAQRAAADSAAAGAAAGPAGALAPLLPPLRLGLPLRLTHGPLAPGGYELRVTTSKGPAALVRRGDCSSTH